MLGVPKKGLGQPGWWGGRRLALRSSSNSCVQTRAEVFQRVQDLLKISSGDMHGHIPWGPQVTTQPPWLLRHNENYASTQQIFRNANTMIWAIGMGTLEGRGRVNSLRTKCSDLEGGVASKAERETCAQVSCDLKKETGGAWAHGQPTLWIFSAAESSLCPCQGSLPSSTPTRAGQQSQDAKSKYFLSTAI